MPIGRKAKGYETISVRPLHIKGASTIYFSSIITEYSDSWSPNWTPTNVYGRMDPVSTYGGTSRELVLGFRVVSDSSEEARENMINIEKLIQYQYPTYQDAFDGQKVLNSPPYLEISFLNLLDSRNVRGSKLTGYINSAVQINPGFQAKEQAQFFNADFTKIYFSDVTVTLRMQVLHEGAIGWNGSRFSHRSYPYNVGSGDSADVADSAGEEGAQGFGSIRTLPSLKETDQQAKDAADPDATPPKTTAEKQDAVRLLAFTADRRRRRGGEGQEQKVLDQQSKQ